MKTLGVVVILFLVAFAVAPANVNAQSTYSARLISPTAGQVLHPGQKVRVQWEATLPNLKHVYGCEGEIWLSLDGGRTFPTIITPPGIPYTSRSFNWIVPNTPSNAAVLDIRFGCEWYYPETPSPQPASTFVIQGQGG